MECPKCKGLMMLERFSDFFLIFYAWKCIDYSAVHRSHDFQQPAQESRRPACTAGATRASFSRHALTLRSHADANAGLSARQRRESPA